MLVRQLHMNVFVRIPGILVLHIRRNAPNESNLRICKATTVSSTVCAHCFGLTVECELDLTHCMLHSVTFCGWLVLGRLTWEDVMYELCVIRMLEQLVHLMPHSIRPLLILLQQATNRVLDYERSSTVPECEELLICPHACRLHKTTFLPFDQDLHHTCQDSSIAPQ